MNSEGDTNIQNGIKVTLFSQEMVRICSGGGWGDWVGPQGEGSDQQRWTTVTLETIPSASCPVRKCSATEDVPLHRCPVLPWPSHLAGELGLTGPWFLSPVPVHLASGSLLGPGRECGCVPTVQGGGRCRAAFFPRAM